MAEDSAERAREAAAIRATVERPGRCPHGHIDGSCPYGYLCKGVHPGHSVKV